MLETLAAMSIGKLILFGILTFAIGIPVLVLLVGMVVASAMFLSPNPPWKDKWNGGTARHIVSFKTHVLGFGIFFIAVGLAILVALVSNVQFWGMVGFALVLGGIGLIIFYLILLKTERKDSLLNSKFEE